MWVHIIGFAFRLDGFILWLIHGSLVEGRLKRDVVGWVVFLGDPGRWVEKVTCCVQQCLMGLKAMKVYLFSCRDYVSRGKSSILKPLVHHFECCDPSSHIAQNLTGYQTPTRSVSVRLRQNGSPLFRRHFHTNFLEWNVCYLDLNFQLALQGSMKSQHFLVHLMTGLGSIPFFQFNSNSNSALLKKKSIPIPIPLIRININSNSIPIPIISIPIPIPIISIPIPIPIPMISVRIYIVYDMMLIHF